MACPGRQYAFGDSIVASTFQSYNPFPSVVAVRRGDVNFNKAVSGKDIISVADAQAYPLTTLISRGTTSITELSVNDCVTWHDSAAGQGSFELACKAVLAYLAIPHDSKTLAQAGGTYSGTWASNANYGGTIAKQTASNGAKATFSLTGRYYLVGTQRSTTNGGEFTVKIGGDAQTGINCAGGATSNDGHTWAPQLMIYDLGSSDTRDLELTAAIGASEVSYLDWVAAFDTVPADWPDVWAGNLIGATDDGYALMSYDAGDVEEFHTLLDNAVAALAATGLRVHLVDLGAWDPNGAGSMNADGEHPTDKGQAEIAAIFLAAMS
jgi:hypothetical protein